MGFLSHCEIACESFLAVTALHWAACSPMNDIIIFLHSSTSLSFSAYMLKDIGNPFSLFCSILFIDYWKWFYRVFRYLR